MFQTCTLLILLIIVNASLQDEEIKAKLNGTVTLKFPPAAKYQRYMVSMKTFMEELHVYRVCNGKNNKTCGYWENMDTKKKVASGKTTYNKNKKLMTIKNFKMSDEGQYFTINGRTHYSVYIK